MNTVRLIIITLFIGCVSFVAIGAESDRKDVQPTLRFGEHWVMQFEYSDEFNEKKLNLRKWDTDVKDWGVWSWEPENTWIKDGYLNLRMQYSKHRRKGKLLSYTSGILKSKASPIKYGYFEVSIKAAQLFPGVCPAFWVYRSEKYIWTEIDFVELTELAHNVRLIDTNTHVFRHQKLLKGKEIHEHRSWNAPWDPRDKFHIYGCEWNDKEIRWYVDGKLVKTRKNAYWHQALDVVISFGVRTPLIRVPSNKEFPTIFKVDYVRVWKKSVP